MPNFLRCALACSEADARRRPALDAKPMTAAPAVSYYRRSDAKTNRRLGKQAYVLSVADTLAATGTRRLCVSVRTIDVVSDAQRRASSHDDAWVAITLERRV